MRNISNYEAVYSSDRIEQIFQVRMRKKKVIELIKKYPHNEILEIGCGLSPLFDDFCDFQHITIVEPGKEFIDNAVKSAESKGIDNAAFICGFLEDKTDELSEREYDYIVLSSLLHEVQNPELLLTSVLKLCSEKTVVHINVPNALSIHRLIAKEMKMISDVHLLSERGSALQQNNVYDIRTLTETVEKCGFFVMENGSYIPKFLTYEQMAQMLVQGIVSEQYFEALNSLSYLFPSNGSEIYVQIKKRSDHD